MCFYLEECDEEFDNVNALAAHIGIHAPNMSTGKALELAREEVEE